MEDNLKLARMASGLSMREVGDIVGLSSASISSIETGKVKNPGILTLMKLADAYSVPLMSLLQGQPEAPDFVIAQWLKERGVSQTAKNKELILQALNLVEGQMDKEEL